LYQYRLDKLNKVVVIVVNGKTIITVLKQHR